ncbi:MAG: cupin [Alphaproteobacteria bacterium]|nr:MAG: cupin [Caulobacteraceae bacterium]TPW08066.1 MAG: cupin [Alphaproteobacteria bacterium]
MSDFRTAMRRIITGDDADGRSVIILDGGPSSQIGDPDIGGLFEIWEDSASDVLATKDAQDLGATKPILGPRKGNFQVRWFVVNPLPEGAPKEAMDAAVRERFAEMGGAGHIIDQTRHPAMHETHSIDVICLLKGRVKLFLEGSETIVEPGQVVIQRGTNHAWEAIGGPALLLAVLIDRPLQH